MHPEHKLSRRAALGLSGAGLAGLALPPNLKAADLTAAERANVQVVNDFCAAWPSHDLAKVLSFFAEDAAYRMSERQEPAKGNQAVSDKINGFLKNVARFEVLDTFARGPMVFNERIDHFQNFALKSWRGVGVFFLRDGKIVEWYDYTIATERG
jgi:limonene-1,2-epoxide hydrolase